MLTAVMILACLLVSCQPAAKKTVHCDNCGKEVEISADSNMDDSWILYCSDCEKEEGASCEAE